MDRPQQPSPNADTPEADQALKYVRAKINQLLEVMGTLPLRPEELDDASLLELDPIGILADSFAQVLEHQQQTNNQLRLAQQEIKAIFNAVSTAVLVLQPDGSVHAANRQSRQLFGFGGSSQEAPLSLEAILPQDQVQILENNLLKPVRQTLSSQQLEFFSVYERSLHVVATPVSRQQRLDLVILNFTDLTGQRQQEALLKAAEERLTVILNAMVSGLVIIDEKTHEIVDVNPAAAQAIGAPRSEIIGHRCHRFICPLEEGNCPLEVRATSVDNSERTLLRKDGTQVPVLKTASKATIDGQTYIIENFIDISARKQARKELAESESRYRALYNSMLEGLALLDLVFNSRGHVCDYRIVDINPAVERMFGFSRQRLLGRRLGRLLGKPQLFYDHQLKQVMHSGQPQTFETKLHLNRQERIFQVSLMRPQKERIAVLVEDITERKAAQRQVERLAYYDNLTELPNRFYLEQRLDAELKQLSPQRLVAVVVMDFDHFKRLNDTLGHDQGDRFLCLMAERLDAFCEGRELLARVAGDEFILMWPDESDQQELAHKASRLLEVVQQPLELEGQEIFGSASVGISLAPMDGQDTAVLVKHAEAAMYQAKSLGRNAYQFFAPDMNRQDFKHLFLGNDLRRALERDEFYLVYQPQLDLHQGQLTGVEALVRWQHPEHGTISPGTFIAMAEENGLIVALGEWVLKQACNQLQAWMAEGFPPLRMAVNISGRQLKEANFVATLGAILESSERVASCLELELTESILMEKADATVRLLQQLKEQGVQLAVDDFGTGYSSLSYLKYFPLDRLKIDRSFVRDIPDDDNDAAIVQAILAMADKLGLKVLAEGVEHAQQLTYLRDQGCQEGQGFYFSPPLSAEQMTHSLQQQRDTGENCFYQGG